MKYRDELSRSMNMMAADPAAVFVGYGLLNGKGGLGTMKDVPNERICETTVAENLMAGMAIGMSLAGFKPILVYERFEFVLGGADAIVNHLDKITKISAGEFNPTAIIRVTVGNKFKPLFTGATHTQDFTEAFMNMVEFPVLPLLTPESVYPAYEHAWTNLHKHSTMLVEWKDLM